MMVTEELESTPLANHSWSPEALRLGAGESQPVLRDSETFRDITNSYPISPTVTEMSPSLEELNRKFEDFIKKGKEEMLNALRLDKDVDSQARLISF
ncbi:BnaC05g08560D [Brassica napus]|uniref:BnaC05g08560D protein n=2 Tax=Brassica TaxID=3705 RepID=A0A078G2U3_BRANA|nr:BnaC05g08560D [Brassica napus]